MKYFYDATVRRIVDGDSVYLMVDLGWRQYHKASIRLHHVDTPEVRGGTEESKRAGYMAKDRVSELLPVGSKCEIECKSLDKYGRGLAIITNADGVNVGEDLISKNLAVPYEGGNKEGVQEAHEKNFAALRESGLL